MQLGRGRVVTNVVAVVVIIALLTVVGIPLVLIFITGTATTILLLIADRSRQREVEKVFLFYVAADAILREEDRRWYGFEIAETIEKGEELLDRMPDSPPLQLFTLGALHFKLGNHSAAAEYLARVTEDESVDEKQRRTASPQLRRYVKLLRRIEAEPAIAPQTLGAIRNLERMRAKRAGQMLVTSRNSADVELPAASFAPTLPLSAITTPPSISEVLHHVYDDEPEPKSESPLV